MMRQSNCRRTGGSPGSAGPMGATSEATYDNPGYVYHRALGRQGAVQHLDERAVGHNVGSVLICTSRKFVLRELRQVGGDSVTAHAIFSCRTPVGLCRGNWQ
jgi:hypothetical protein